MHSVRSGKMRMQITMTEEQGRILRTAASSGKMTVSELLKPLIEALCNEARRVNLSEPGVIEALVERIRK